MVRTLAVLDDVGQEIPETFRDDLPRLTGWLQSLQREDGLWNCFVDEPTTGPETSGSAGIAAAMAIAAKRGWVDAAAIDNAQRCVAGLTSYLEPDGLLGGMSPSNKREAGPEVQRCGQRVLGGAATGLAGQLLAALPDGDAVHMPSVAE
jgi:rhamnogalacturonyl hydrolase YesR